MSRIGREALRPTVPEAEVAPTAERRAGPTILADPELPPMAAIPVAARIAAGPASPAGVPSWQTHVQARTEGVDAPSSCTISKKQARKMLEDLEPLRPKVLHEKLEGAEALLEQAVCAHASNPLDLAKAYVLLARIETDATAALDEAAVGAVWADENGKPKRSTKYEGVQDAARELLAGVGRAYALNCSAFSAILLGDSVWPTRYEAPKSGGALLFINGFKMTADLSPEARKAVFAERLEEFLGAGGQMEQVRILDKSGIEALEVGERYEYVLLSDKRIRFAAIPKKEEGIGPGHSVLAEGGFVFRDARALCAGEFWVSRGPDGDITAFSISCGSGHFKPFFDALSEVNGPLAKLGLEPDRIVHYGGPSSARKAARKLFEKAGLSKAEAKARLPLAVPLRRLEWRSLVQV